MGIYDIIPRPYSVRVLEGTSECDKISVAFEPSMSDEEYVIMAQENQICLKASDERGIFYARQTLKQICCDGKIQNCIIWDKPRYSYRGFMLDSARHMQTLDEIKTYIDAAAMLKFNKFHWHLSDDQGWRIECESYPELNSVGSYRKSSDFGKKHINEVYGGYYKKSELREIVKYCHERHISVIPEVDMPGHSTAAIASYPELSCREEKLDVETRQGIYKNILCSGKESTFDFVFAVLDELCEIFPDEYIHIGGDEAPKNRWDSCPYCQRRLRDLHLSDTEQLQGWFTNRVIKYLEDKGRHVIVWNESLKSGLLNSNAVVQNWMDRDKLCPTWANNGGKMIVSDFYHYYLDYPYGMTPLDKTLAFEPVIEGVNARGADNILGVEAPIWTEYVDNFSRLCYLVFPRLVAVAQTAWAQYPMKSEEFIRRMSVLQPLLEKMGVKAADLSECNLKPLARLRQVVEFFSGTVDSETVKTFLFGEKD